LLALLASEVAVGSFRKAVHLHHFEGVLRLNAFDRHLLRLLELNVFEDFEALPAIPFE